jgi:aspartate-semialdehyde dehydrogenase
VRAFASARSAGKTVPYGSRALTIEEATPEALSAGDLDLCLFSVGTGASRELVPHASAAGAICVDKSSAYRLVDGYPLVVPEVNGSRALEALERDRIVANPNCCTIPLTCVLKPLHEVAGLARVRVSTYQSVSGAGAQRMEQLRHEPAAEHNLVMDWSWEGDETDEESKLRAETQKIMELPDLPISATTVRVPILIAHSEAIWIETEEPLSPEQAAEILRGAPSVRVLDLPAFPTPKDAAGGDEVLVGRIRGDRAADNGLALFLSCDNLRKGAALNALQIAELLLSARPVAA